MEVSPTSTGRGQRREERELRGRSKRGKIVLYIFFFKSPNTKKFRGSRGAKCLSSPSIFLPPSLARFAGRWKEKKEEIQGQKESFFKKKGNYFRILSAFTFMILRCQVAVVVAGSSGR